MKFGLFHELQCPRPWEADTEHKLYQNALSQVEPADRPGYHYAWENEPDHQAWKRKVLSREIEWEDIDTTPYKDRAGAGKGVSMTKLASAAE